MLNIDEVNHCHAEVISVQPFKQTRCTMPLRSAAGPLRCAIHRLNLGCFKAAGLPASFTSG